MSARKSFDVRRKKKETSHGRVVARKRVRDRRPLKVRRREAMKRGAIMLVIGISAIVALVLVVLWRPELRISRIEAPQSLDPATLETLARTELHGTYHGIIPRDSFFFYPERAIRASILATYPSASAVSISRIGFDAIEIKTSERIFAFRWCGTTADTTQDCYDTDAEGYVFAQSAPAIASSTPELEVYSALTPPEDMSAYPLRAQVEGAHYVPDILRFVRAVQSLGVMVEKIAIRGDEADLVTPLGVRLTYVIGTEEEAAKSAAAAFANLNLKDGSVEYVDLRFPGKAYVKRSDE